MRTSDSQRRRPGKGLARSREMPQPRGEHNFGAVRSRTIDRMRIAFFGSSLVSAYWNGAATYYRGLLRALAARGHVVTFYEPDAFDRQANRDIPDPRSYTINCQRSLS